MTSPRSSSDVPLFLGIEGGGTRTRARVVDAHDRPIASAEAGPANLQLLTDRQLRTLLRSLATRLPKPCALAIGLAGARTESHFVRIRQHAEAVWPGVPCYATNDLETALFAAAGTRRGERRPIKEKPTSRVLVLSGTGSCCYGRGADGSTGKVGGWGHVLGDRGSAYHVGLDGLRVALADYDRRRDVSTLGRRLLRKLQMNNPEELVSWVQSAAKAQIAALAVEVFDAWRQGDRLAESAVRQGAAELAADAVACAARLPLGERPTEFILAGGMLTRQSAYARLVARLIRGQWPRARVRTLQRETVWGAVEMARQLPPGPGTTAGDVSPPGERNRPGGRSEARDAAIFVPDSKALDYSPTERSNPRSSHLSTMSLGSAIELMLSEDAHIPGALLKQRPKIERAIRLIVRAFRSGGRLFYVGAGTSGRLGVLDASECPPTFNTAPNQVQGIIAGGQRALWESVEGAEDDASAGAEAVRLRGVKAKDLVVGIAASGYTPFVWGALGEGRRRRARTILLCFNPAIRIPAECHPGLVIAADVGPEILTGSTRLKAGTATKLILNLFTTLSMVQLGKVRGNLMVDLNPSNVKLRHRAVRIVQALSGASEETACAALQATGWVVTAALKRLRDNPD
jgi:N-acetylmuramic acid 6-phosphate etherase